MAITVVEAGRLGGRKVLRTRGPDFFVGIGRKGQAAMRKKYAGRASEWGRLGGRPRKLKLQEAGEQGK